MAVNVVEEVGNHLGQCPFVVKSSMIPSVGSRFLLHDCSKMCNNWEVEHSKVLNVSFVSKCWRNLFIEEEFKYNSKKDNESHPLANNEEFLYPSKSTFLWHYILLERWSIMLPGLPLLNTT